MLRDSCDRCSNWADSPSEVSSVLKGERETCAQCANKKAMEVVVRQFKSNHPRWWVVDGAVVIPIWIVERLRNRRQSG